MSQIAAFTSTLQTSFLTDGQFLQPIGTGSNLTPWSDWINAGITRSIAPGGIPGDYASLPVGGDLFQRFSALPPGNYTLSFLVQNQSAWSAQLVLAVQQILGTPASVVFPAGTADVLYLPASTAFIAETFNFTISSNQGFTLN